MTEEAPTDQAVVVADGLTHVFNGHRGVSDVDFEVPTGRILGLVGPSGSGKTTMVRLVLGLLAPQQGTVEVLGRSPSEFTDEVRARIGYLPQDIALDPSLSLRHNLNFMASLYGLPLRGRWLFGDRSRRARHRIEEVLELLDLQDSQHTRLRDASTGEQRRLALAAALVHEPDLLVLDEPTAGIDPVLREQLWDHFDQLRTHGTSIFVTTQYVSEADNCDLVALLVEGSVLATAGPDRLRRMAYGGDLVEVQHQGGNLPLHDVTTVEGVRGIEGWDGPRRVLVRVDDAATVAPRINKWLDAHDAESGLAAPAPPSFDDVFVRMVSAHRDEDAPTRRRVVAGQRAPHA